MLQLKFLKLEGLRGLSYAPRHIGDFDIWNYTFSRQPIRKAGAKQLPDDLWNHLVVYKRTDETSNSLRMAYSKDRAFASGELVVEEVNEKGNLLRTTAFKLRSIIIDKLESINGEDTIALKFQSMSVVG